MAAPISSSSATQHSTRPHAGFSRITKVAILALAAALLPQGAEAGPVSYAVCIGTCAGILINSGPAVVLLPGCAEACLGFLLSPFIP